MALLALITPGKFNVIIYTFFRVTQNCTKEPKVKQQNQELSNIACLYYDNRYLNKYEF